MRLIPSVRLPAMCALAVALTGALVVPATATPDPAPPQTASSGLGMGVADLSRHPAYAAFFSQQLTWSTSLCRGVARLSPESRAPQLAEVVRKVSPEAVQVLDEALTTSVPARMECAQIQAPKNWAQPDAGTLLVGISRPLRTPSSPRPERLLLSNPGGPGSPGLFFGQDAEKAMKTEATHLSVGIDPRGLGLSSAVTCPAVPMAMPGTPGGSIEAQVRAQAAQLKKCHAEKDTLLPYVDTVSTARDFNLVRHLMGYERADYFGVSYGSWLGAVLGKMFPQHFDRIVLDSSTEWTSGSFSTVFGKNYPRGIQTSLERAFYPWVARHHSSYGLGATGPEVQATVQAAEAKAATLGTKGAELLYGMTLFRVLAARQPQESSAMAAGVVQQSVAAIIAATPPSGSPSTAPAAPQPEPQRENVTTTAVVCNDSGSTGSLENEIARVTQLERSYPLVGGGMAFTTCVDWPRPATLTSAIMNLPLRGVLMLQDENDAPTPYQGAFLNWVREGKGVRMVLVDDGHGHVAFRYPCAARAGSAYLTAGTYPEGDVHCQAGPLPAEKQVYEFGFPASPKRPLSQTFIHHSGEVVDPEVDQEATAGVGQPKGGDDATAQVGRQLALRQALSEALSLMR